MHTLRITFDMAVSHSGPKLVTCNVQCAYTGCYVLLCPSPLTSPAVGHGDESALELLSLMVHPRCMVRTSFYILTCS